MLVRNNTIVFLLLTLIFLSMWMVTYIIRINNKVEDLLKDVQELQLEVATYTNGRHLFPRSIETENQNSPKYQQVTDRILINPTNIIIPSIQRHVGDSANNSKPFKMPHLDGVNVISMSLWGADGRYINGALKNAELVKVFFPGWTLRIYTETRSSGSSHSPKYPVVPVESVDKLRSLGAEIEYINPREVNIPAMMWRFLVADDLSVDRFIVRDSDGRLSSRDSAAVYQWVLSGKPFNCIRDHPSHANYAVSGGLWGGIPSNFREIFRRPFKEIMFGYKDDYLQDMNFLNEIVWPRIRSKAFCSDSVSCDKYESSHPYPVPRHGYEFVGEVYDGEGLRRPVDVNILRRAGVNDLCVPQPDLEG